jgi:HD superfamily phosphodiesterase
METKEFPAILRNFVFALFRNRLPAQAVYHDFTHTEQVVGFAEEIGQAEGLDQEQMEILMTAAWLHDTGYTEVVDDHESKSQDIARSFLEENSYPEKKIKEVLDCIGATKMPQSPGNLLGRILCDADLYHLGSDEFGEKSDLLRLELSLLCGQEFTDREWLEKNELFLQEHSYFTDYAYAHLGKKKSQNWMAIKKNLKKLLAKEEERKAKEKTKKESVKLKKVNGDSPDRGIQTMYRVTLRNHIKLSDIADTKANILLSVNAIILSITLSILFPKLDKQANNYLIVPTILFLATTIVAMIFSILATRPKITAGKFTQIDVKNRKVNLLFFGNFHQMSLDDFQEGMHEIMRDKEYLYDSLMKDLYYLGKVLDRKYRILRYAYNIFMFGIIFSVISFVISFLEVM